MKGSIIINAFRRPEESVRQAERLKEEFNKLNVDVQILSDGFLRSGVFNNALFTDVKKSDFIIYLDKDKYTSSVLDKTGVRLFNSHNAIRLCDDKADTYIALASAGVPVPDTVFGALSYSNEDSVDVNRLKTIGEELCFPMIVKECFGSMGKGVYLAKDIEELKDISEKLKGKPHLFQKYLSFKFGTDIRVIVIGGCVVGAIERKNEKDFRSNVTLGGKTTAVNLPENFRAVAEQTSKALKLDYCGVDILYGDSGEPVVCEVNSNAFFFGFERATGINIAKTYAEYVIKSI